MAFPSRIYQSSGIVTSLVNVLEIPLSKLFSTLLKKCFSYQQMYYFQFVQDHELFNYEQGLYCIL
jgi:hypothetical protein